MCIRDSIVGLRAGRIVFDGPPEALTTETLTEIYGEEDWACLLYTSDAADERSSVDLGGRRIIKKKTKTSTTASTMHTETQT